MNTVLVCRICGRKYMVYGMEVREDPSVCRQCEREAREGSLEWKYKRKPNDPIARFGK